MTAEEMSEYFIKKSAPFFSLEIDAEPKVEKREKMKTLILDYGLDFIVSLNFTHIARPWTIQDYLNDPRMLNDPDMAGALEPIREIHAARLMLQDETAGMTAAQKSEYLKKKIRLPCLPAWGFPLRKSLISQAGAS
jgi:hypothetical protein